DGIRDFHVTGVQTCALPISTGVLSKHDTVCMRADKLDASRRGNVVSARRVATLLGCRREVEPERDLVRRRRAALGTPEQEVLTVEVERLGPARLEDATHRLDRLGEQALLVRGPEPDLEAPVAQPVEARRGPPEDGSGP